MYENITIESNKAITELLMQSKLGKGSILLVGCSSSEMVGNQIGKGSSIDAAKALFEGVYHTLKEQGIYLAVQCCEHLNRAIVVEKELALKKELEIVNAIPQIHAGGSFAVTAWENFDEPVLVETIKADAGMDIGGTLIGMHLKKVAVPVRVGLDKIGEANIICARTRPKYIGGERAVYQEL